MTAGLRSPPQPLPTGLPDHARPPGHWALRASLPVAWSENRAGLEHQVDLIPEPHPQLSEFTPMPSSLNLTPSCPSLHQCPRSSRSTALRALTEETHCIFTENSYMIVNLAASLPQLTSFC